MISYFIYFLVLIATALALPNIYFDTSAKQFIFALGTLAIWRYGWALIHFTRSLIYRKIIFPSIREKANALGDIARPNHVFLLLTTFRIGTEVTIRTYQAAIADAIACKTSSTIVASIVEMSEERLIKALFYAQNPPQNVKLKIVRISGTGKRDALAVGFRAISNSTVDLENSVVSVIDGDSILPIGSTEACYSMFSLNPKLGALTTDEDCELYGNDFATNLYRKWYSMRFAQRHIYMSSNSLSNKVLTLTGRMSMFRASIVTTKEFIQTIEFDYIDHWRLGRFQFLTGDDKSSWFHLLKDGWQMWYIPDVSILTIEEIPDKNFFIGATVLMRRWFGNMLRANTRALKLQRKTIGNFTWWNLWDQRFSMWTSLFGLFAALIGAIVYDSSLILIFIWWIAFTRFTQSLMLLSSRKHISITWPFLIYFNQIYGSLVKIYILNHLNRQKWTRQKTTFKQTNNSFDNWFIQSSSSLSFLASLLVFITLIAFTIGAVNIQDIYQMSSNIINQH